MGRLTQLLYFLKQKRDLYFTSDEQRSGALFLVFKKQFHSLSVLCSAQQPGDVSWINQWEVQNIEDSTLS